MLKVSGHHDLNAVKMTKFLRKSNMFHLLKFLLVKRESYVRVEDFCHVRPHFDFMDRSKILEAIG